MQGTDVEWMIRHCRKEIERSGLIRELELKAIPKPSMRRKEKQRLSVRRRRRRELKLEQARERYEAMRNG